MSQPKPKILVIGDLILDEYVYGDCSRISPEAPVPVVNEVRRTLAQGGAGNVVENLKALGADVLFWHGNKSSHKLRIIAGHQQVCRLDNDDCSLVPSPSELEDWVFFVDVVVLSDYRKGVIHDDLINEVNFYCAKHHKPLLVDPYNGRCDYGPEVSLIKPNQLECQSVTGIPITDPVSLRQSATKYLELSQAQHLVVTQGANGMTLFYSGNIKEPFHTVQPAQQVFDVTGAGDTAMAALAYIWAGGRPGQFSKQAAVTWAAKAASIVVGKLGTAIISFDELFGPYLDIDGKGTDPNA